MSCRQPSAGMKRQRLRSTRQSCPTCATSKIGSKRVVMKRACHYSDPKRKMAGERSIAGQLSSASTRWSSLQSPSFFTMSCLNGTTSRVLKQFSSLSQTLRSCITWSHRKYAAFNRYMTSSISETCGLSARQLTCHPRTNCRMVRTEVHSLVKPSRKR